MISKFLLVGVSWSSESLKSFAMRESLKSFAMTKRLKSTVLHSTRVPISMNKKHRVGNIIAINEGFCLLKMMKCRRRQATDPQKFKKLSTVVFC